MKKKLFVLAAVMIILAVLGTGTLAYFTTSTVAHNVITSGEIDIDLVETMEKDGNIVPYPSEPVGGIVPGMAHSKIVNVSNVGSNPAWVRVKVIITAEDDDGKALPTGVLTLDYNTEKWIEKDGYYYYDAVLPAGATTAAPLFTEVLFSGEGMGNEYQNAHIEIDVQAYATQAQNNGTTVMEAKGWPMDILGTIFS